MIDTFVEAVVPLEAMKLYEVAAPLYRIHWMWSSQGGGAHVECKWSKQKNKYGFTQLSDEPSGFHVHWGMRPLGVSMDGFLSLSAHWRLFKKGYRFEGFGALCNYPGHTAQNGAFRWKPRSEVEFDDLLVWVTEEAVSKFLHGCDGVSCSGKNHDSMQEAEVLTEGGPTTSGKGPLVQRVW